MKVIRTLSPNVARSLVLTIVLIAGVTLTDAETLQACSWSSDQLQCDTFYCVGNCGVTYWSTLEASWWCYFLHCRFDHCEVRDGESCEYMCGMDTISYCLN